MSLPKPYYEDKARGIVIYHGDARDILPHLEKVDLLLTDPPYGIAAKLKGGGTWTKGTGLSWFHETASTVEWDKVRVNELVQDCLFKSRDQVIWGGNYYSLPISMGWLVWHKPYMMPSFSDCELAWTSRDSAVKMLSVAPHERVAESVAHPTQKPLALMRWCLGFFPKAKTVLDPFMGSGTTLVACKQLGRKCIGIELEERYCEIAARRLAQDLLFDADELADLSRPA